MHGVAGKLFLGEEGGAPIGVVDGDGVRIRQPLSCGVAQTCLASHDNVLWAWGANQHGQCGRTGHAESEVMAGLVAIGWTAVLPVFADRAVPHAGCDAHGLGQAAVRGGE